jgi:hypothetical protein
MIGEIFDTSALEAFEYKISIDYLPGERKTNPLVLRCRQEPKLGCR